MTLEEVPGGPKSAEPEARVVTGNNPHESEPDGRGFPRGENTETTWKLAAHTATRWRYVV